MATSHKVLPMFYDAPMLSPENYFLAGWFGMEQGISPQGIGTIGMLLNFVVTITISLLTPPPPQEVLDLVESVRVPKGSGEAVSH